MSNLNIAASNLKPLGAALNIKKPTMTGPKETSFGDTLAESLKEVNKMQHAADDALENLVTGKSKNLHETMMTIGKAEIAFKLTMQVRNKVLEAYKEVMNTAV